MKCPTCNYKYRNFYTKFSVWVSVRKREREESWVAFDTGALVLLVSTCNPLSTTTSTLDPKFYLTFKKSTSSLSINFPPFSFSLFYSTHTSLITTISSYMSHVSSLSLLLPWFLHTNKTTTSNLMHATLLWSLKKQYIPLTISEDENR